MHLARALKSADQPARSAEMYRSVLQLQPHHPTAHYKLGSVLRHMCKHEAAAEAYRYVWVVRVVSPGVAVGLL
jgi:predicted TPR repeat methyltransferase